MSNPDEKRATGRLAELLKLSDEQLLAEIRAVLNDLTADAIYASAAVRVSALAKSHQAGPGFLSSETRAAMAVQNEKDRRAQALRQSRGEPLGHGSIAIPGNVSAMSITDNVHRELRNLIRLLTAQLYRHRGVCVTRRLPVEPTFPDLSEHLKAVLDLVDSRPALTRTLLVLEDLRTALTKFVEGDDRQAWGECPECGLETLVKYARQRIIRCEKAPGTTHFQPCVCADPLCDCKRRPVSYRHTWGADKGPSRRDSWSTLAARQGIVRAATAKAKKKRKKK